MKRKFRWTCNTAPLSGKAYSSHPTAYFIFQCLFPFGGYSIMNLEKLKTIAYTKTLKEAKDHVETLPIPVLTPERLAHFEKKSRLKNET